MVPEIHAVESPAVTTSKDKHLIHDEHFQRLTALRDEVYQATEVNPTVRKLLYLIIDRADLESIRDHTLGNIRKL